MCFCASLAVVFFHVLGVPELGLSTDDLEAYEKQVIVEENRCGPIALWYCAKSFEKDVQFKEIARAAGSDNSGTTIRGIIDAAKQLKLSPVAVKVKDVEDLASAVLPCILVIEPSHCIVIECIDTAQHRVCIFEPSSLEHKSILTASLFEGPSHKAILFESDSPSTPESVGILFLIGGSTFVAFVILGKLFPTSFAR